MSKKKKDWKTEKERLLRLDREERRKEYRRQDYISLDKIPTWREDNNTNDNEEETQVTSRGGLSDKVSLYKGDITLLEVDAIVNAANSSLLGGGGVDGCIHKAAGSCLFDECHTLNGCDTGKAKITCGYDLPAKYVIHTVGPVARGHVGPSETSDLTSCYQNSLRLVKEHGLSSVAFPCISTGIYGFPNDPAADIALDTVKSWIEQNPDKITRVIFCVFLETDFNIYKKKMAIVFQDNEMEVTEEQQKDDTTPLSSKDETEEASRGEEDPNVEQEGTDDAEKKADVDMMSQNLDEEMGLDEPNPDEKEKQDEDENQVEATDADNAKDADTDTANDKEKGMEEESAAKPVQEQEPKDEDDTQCTVEMDDVSDRNKTGTSNGDTKDEVTNLPDLNATDNIQSKVLLDTDGEKKD